MNKHTNMVLELLIKVLEFYGDENSYKKAVRDGTFISLVELDKGEKAKTTLRNIRDLKQLEESNEKK